MTATTDRAPSLFPGSGEGARTTSPRPVEGAGRGGTTGPSAGYRTTSGSSLLLTAEGPPAPTCARCPRPRRYPTCGLCDPCYQQWRRDGRPDLGTWQPHVQCSTSAESVAGRREDYAELRGFGLSVEDAAARLGVHERTGWRYERQLRAEETGPAA